MLPDIRQQERSARRQRITGSGAHTPKAAQPRRSIDDDGRCCRPINRDPGVAPPRSEKQANISAPWPIQRPVEKFRTAARRASRYRWRSNDPPPVPEMADRKAAGKTRPGDIRRRACHQSGSCAGPVSDCLMLSQGSRQGLRRAVTKPAATPISSLTSGLSGSVESNTNETRNAVRYGGRGDQSARPA